MTDPRIEAAARAMCGRFNEGDASIWDDLPNSDREYYREAARVVLEAADAAAWRPIESAPRDGTECLIGWSSTGWHVQTAWWDAEFDTGWDEEIDDIKHIGAWTGGVVESWGDETTLTYNPTHWMPLPAPPQEAVHD
ncbi:DUF551 domain-containing protein [Brytella acorum]|uniref:DUF551 domain-containing protein n=1 Tax=Brytella acorum TaxID=2959299 RepID=A0AA35ULD6_9PROT|nr:DUF551 domain-containing protein [Brytella acorum]CAI9119573.1 DUF551 domain-containing protein [Brytella acorum]